MKRTTSIPRFLFMFLVMLVPFADAEQDIAGQVTDKPAALGEQPSDAGLLLLNAETELPNSTHDDPNISHETVGIPEDSNRIETTPTRPVSGDKLPLDSDNGPPCALPELPAPPEAGIMLDSWFYYFSSLAQTIAAGSALLVALAVIRLQALASSLNEIQRSVANAFFDIGRQRVYNKQAFNYFLNNQWSVYFNEVEVLLRSNEQLFSTEKYTKSKDFLESLIAQGRKFEERNRQLYHALVLAFSGTIIFAGTAILVLPVARWISPFILSWSWAVSGFSLVILFAFYLRLVLGYMKSK